MAFDKSKFKVRNDNVLLRRLSEQDRTHGGIALPDSKYEKNLVCEVLAVGPGTYSQTGVFYPGTKAKVGELVIVRQFEGVKFDKVNPNLFFTSCLVVEAVVEIDNYLNITSVKPLLDYLLIKPDASITKTEGGLIIPEVARLPNEWGEIVAAGTGYYHEHTGELVQMRVKVGDRAHYSRWGGYSVEVSGVHHIMLKEWDLFAYEEKMEEAVCA